MASPAVVVREQQREWALGRGIALDASDYTLDLADNLFVQLSAAARDEFAGGDGDELGRPGERGKMQALHSSSALACNVFEYWRDRDASALAASLGSTAPLQIGFERKYPTGLRGNAPNLDVVLRPASGRVVAIECKFLEPYAAHGPGFKEKYFEASPGLWEDAGYPRCQALAQALYSGECTFRWLYAEQLLKHILGLARWGDAWRLLYLWYQVPGPAGPEHAAEADQFARVVTEDGIDFAVLSYQTLFKELRERARYDDRAYVDYLGERYFAGSD
jgi:hypothetical protein